MTEPGTFTEITFDTIGWQTVPPRTWTRLDGEPGTEIYHEEPGALRIMTRRTLKGVTAQAMNSGAPVEIPTDVATIPWNQE